LPRALNRSEPDALTLRSSRNRTSSRETAQALLQVVMLVMQSVAAELRGSRRYLEPTQMGSLMRIAVGPCTMTELARHKAVSLPTISKSVNMLVRRGWVERAIDTQDRRQTLVRLTPAGRRALADIQEVAEQHVAERLGPLTADERRELMSLLGRLTTVLG
jgi:DNA-binding MarR family transcriptional regulator